MGYGQANQTDREMMTLALAQARISLESGGVPVGAALAAGGQLVAAGHNERVQRGELFEKRQIRQRASSRLSRVARERGRQQIRTFFRQSTGQIVLIASKLPPLPAGKAYELWFIGTDGKAPVPAGTFSPDAQGNVTAKLSQIQPRGGAKQFAVTIEKASGSPTPTTPILYSGSQGE